jgi:membrane-bound ClpP family serine protease
MNIEGMMTDVPVLLAQTGNGADQGVNWLAVWAVLLLTLAVALFFIEIFVPSGGLIGTGAAACLVIGIVMLFRVDTMLGLVGAAIALLALPFALAFAIKLLPNTPVVRALTLRTGKSGVEVDTDEEYEPDTEAEEQHGPVGTASLTTKGVPDTPEVGATGKAISALRPVGTCVINGTRAECLAVGGPISPGTRVEVIAVDGMHVRVRAAG